LTFDQVEKLEHIRIYNRGDCCEHRLNNAIIELFNAEGDLLFSHNIGPATKVEDVYLGRVYNQVKQLKIRLNGRKILSLAEVDVFGPTNQPRVPDYARVLAYVPNLFTDFKCESTEVPSESLSPSTTPTLSLSPSIYKAIPSNVVLLRDDTPCISQVSPSNHPDRFKCFIEPVTSNSKPGGHNNDPVALVGRDGCIIVVQPATWAWSESAFIFQALESLDSINACFAIGTLITESGPAIRSATPSMAVGPATIPTAAPSMTIVPKDVVILQDDSACTSQVSPSNHSDRFKCFIEPTTPSSKPGGHNNDPVALVGRDGCIIVVQPATWAWAGNAFIFESTESLDSINACFAIGTLITESGPAAIPTAAPSMAVGLATIPTAAPSITIVPKDVVLLRDDSACISQVSPSNHPDRFKCFIEPTTPSSKPGGHNNDPVALVGRDGCIIVVQPVTWAWAGNAFIFESVESLDSINACFGIGTEITASLDAMASEAFIAN